MAIRGSDLVPALTSKLDPGLLADDGAVDVPGHADVRPSVLLLLGVVNHQIPTHKAVVFIGLLHQLDLPVITEPPVSGSHGIEMFREPFAFGTFYSGIRWLLGVRAKKKKKQVKLTGYAGTCTKQVGSLVLCSSWRSSHQVSPQCGLHPPAPPQIWVHIQWHHLVVHI